jgi:hypothetical protein
MIWYEDLYCRHARSPRVSTPYSFFARLNFDSSSSLHHPRCYRNFFSIMALASQDHVFVGEGSYCTWGQSGSFRTFQ